MLTVAWSVGADVWLKCHGLGDIVCNSLVCVAFSKEQAELDPADMEDVEEVEEEETGEDVNSKGMTIGLKALISCSLSLLL